MIEEERIPQVGGLLADHFHVVFERTGDRAVRFVQELPETLPRGSIRRFGPGTSPIPGWRRANGAAQPHVGHHRPLEGVMLTVNNLTGNVLFARDAVNTRTGTRYFQRGGRTLSFLPLAHAYGCAFDFLAPLAVGGHITPCWGAYPRPRS